MSAIRIVNLSVEVMGCCLFLIIIFSMVYLGRTKTRLDLLFLHLLIFNMGGMLMDAIAAAFIGRTGAFSFFAIRAANFSSFFFDSCMTASFLYYELTYLENKRKFRYNQCFHLLGNILLIVQFALLTLNLFVPFIYYVDSSNIYHRLPLYPVLYIPIFTAMIAAFLLLLYNRPYLQRHELFPLMFYILCPCISVGINVFIYGLNIGYIGILFTILILYFSLQLEQGQLVAEQERELTESHVALMISQIQPHFLFNALNSIEYLCDSGSPDAGSAINHFSKYLRVNMDSISQTAPVPFSQELTHLNNYLYIEHLRFPNITVEYDLQYQDFLLPSLTLQPLVENAIRHGVRNKADGHIIIHTWRDTSSCYLSVEDNGVGFDPQSIPNKKPTSASERSHVGLTNTKTRLNLICSGKLDIQSTCGVGTIVTITIPKP